MATKQSRKVVIVKKAPKVKFAFPVGVPLNIKVEGERTMMKGVRLEPFGDEDRVWFKVLTGRRGRPMLLHVEQIERVRAL